MAISFDELLTELEPHMGINMKPDAQDCCRMRFDERIHLQVEFDRKTSKVLIHSELGYLPPGRFREDYLRSALIENGKRFPRIGVIAFSTKSSGVVFFDFVELDSVNGEQFYQYIQLFIEKAKKWVDGLEHGHLPVDSDDDNKPPAPGAFGLRP